MTDINAVYDVIKQIDHLTNQSRNRHLHHQSFDRAGSHILFSIRHEFYLLFVWILYQL